MRNRYIRLCYEFNTAMREVVIPWLEIELRNWRRAAGELTKAGTLDAAEQCRAKEAEILAAVMTAREKLRRLGR